MTDMMPLLASIDWAGYWDWTVAILTAALGLGFIIFVHELGHFAVAKWCGVKCDKFFIGFDIGGYKLSKKWGETEYGIGILPLGGYVKMMGQDDDPRVTTEEIQQSLATDPDMPSKEITGPNGEKFLVDKRSYLAKSVPQRMAIISAGVIMNIIFAYIFAVIAFGGRGVPTQTCHVGATVPGSPAWQNGLRPGDRIAKLGDIEDPWFPELKTEVTLASSEESLPIVVERVDGSQVEMSLKPDRSGFLPAIGITGYNTLELIERKYTRPNSPAAELKDQIPGGGTIESVNGEPVEDYAQWQAALVRYVAEPIELSIVPPAKDGETASPVGVTLAPNRRETLGIAVGCGAISAIEKEGPGDKAGLKSGDLLLAVDGKSLEAHDGNPAEFSALDLAEYCRVKQLASESVTFSVARDGNRDKTEEVVVEPRKATWESQLARFDDPFGVPQLGIAIPLLPRIVSVDTILIGDADVKIGDSIATATCEIPEDSEIEAPFEEIEFEEHPRAFAVLSDAIQDLPETVAIKLTLVREGADKPIEVTLHPQQAEGDEHFTVRRGLRFRPYTGFRRAESFGEQLSMGAGETWYALTTVYRFLARLTSGDISVGKLGGPVMIAQGAAATAKDGWGTFLLFLTLISANLAVVNFLPIPVLDGGHMVFLIYEGIFRRPAPDKLVTALSLLGLAMILSLMIFVIGLDVGLIPRW